MTCQRVLLMGILFIGLAARCTASGTRGEWINRLKQLGLALHNYESVFGHLPHDLVDVLGEPPGRPGKRHLSWRVGTLPFVEYDNLYRQFDIAQSWDSAANKRLLTKPDFRNYYANYFHSRRDQELAGVVMPRGPGTFWGDGGRRTLKDVKGDPARSILLVEVAEDAAPVWTEPRDLVFDPKQPRKGLGWHWQTGLMGERGCFAVFADGDVRLLSESLSDEQIRKLFSGESTGPLTLNWLEAMTQMPIGRGIAPTLAIGLLAIIGALVVAWKSFRGRPVSPGELLWLILGAEYLVFFAYFVARYEYRFLGQGRWGDPSMYMALVLPARLAGCATCLLGLIRLAKTPGWWFVFAGILVLMALGTLDAATPGSNAWAEVAFISMPMPFVMALAGLAAMAFTWNVGCGANANRIMHWAGVLVCFVPLIWFCIWSSNGYAVPTEWFVRIRE